MLCWRVAILGCCLIYCFFMVISCEKTTQLVVEHPTVTYTNPRFFQNLTITSKRYSRKDPNRYISIYAVTNKSFDNHLSINFSFYELLSNVYKPSFVGLRFTNYCEWVAKDTYIASAFSAAYLRSTPVEKQIEKIGCPFPPGEYVFGNFTIPNSPIFKRFPFLKGRIVANISYDIKETVASFYFDMALKTV